MIKISTFEKIGKLLQGCRSVSCQDSGQTVPFNKKHELIFQLDKCTKYLKSELSVHLTRNQKQVWEMCDCLKIGKSVKKKPLFVCFIELKGKKLMVGTVMKAFTQLYNAWNLVYCHLLLDNIPKNENVTCEIILKGVKEVIPNSMVVGQLNESFSKRSVCWVCNVKHKKFPKPTVWFIMQLCLARNFYKEEKFIVYVIDGIQLFSVKGESFTNFIEISSGNLRKHAYNLFRLNSDGEKDKFYGLQIHFCEYFLPKLQK